MTEAEARGRAAAMLAEAGIVLTAATPLGSFNDPMAKW